VAAQVADAPASASFAAPIPATSRGIMRRLRDRYRAFITRLPQAFVGMIWHNPLFDAAWYRSEYPDLAGARMKPEIHYRRYGAKEGRQPNPFFDTRWYVENNPDVASGPLNPLDHFLLFGASENRNPSSLFDTRWYVAAYPDVAASGINPLLHYLRFGQAEDRLPVPGEHEAPAPAVTSGSAGAGGSRGYAVEPMAAPADRSQIANDVTVIAFYNSSYYSDPDPAALATHDSSGWLAVARTRVPADLGFYDLRLPETRAQQADLARSYGIHGFCYSEVWGHPDRHARPFRDMLASGEPDFPFTLQMSLDPGLAGLEARTIESHLAQLRTALEAVADKRAIRVGTHPVLLMDGLDASGDERVADLVRREAERAGLPGIFIIAPIAVGSDAEAIRGLGVDAVLELHPAPWAMTTFDEYVRRALETTATTPTMQTVLTGWDESSLNGQRRVVLTGSIPPAYGEWLRAAVTSARDNLPREQRFVFVASWNDWTHGAYLEPDILHGHAYLESTRASLAPPLWAADEVLQ
jgi:hypothetical protein